MATWSTILLLVSALLFLGTVGYLVANAGAVACLFGKRRREAEPGDLIVDRRAAGREASPGAIRIALAIHVLGVIGLVAGGLAATRDMLGHHPDADPLPAEMLPVPARGE